MENGDLVGRMVKACQAAIGTALENPAEALAVAHGLRSALDTLNLVAGETVKGEAGLREVVGNAAALTQGALASVLAHTEGRVDPRGIDVSSALASLAVRPPAPPVPASSPPNTMPLFSEQQPLYFHNDATKNRRVGSLDTHKLKWLAPICAECNNVRTQPHDRAWTTLSAALRSRLPQIAPGMIIRTDRIFRMGTHASMLNVYLFFAKQFGCTLVEAGSPVSADALASAILAGRHCPNFYLKFASARREERNMVSGSDLHVDRIKGTDALLFAAAIYHVGPLKVLMMLAGDGQWRDGMAGAWHPKTGTTRLVIADLVK